MVSIYLFVIGYSHFVVTLSAYQTFVDVLLRDWSQHELPQTCVQVGWEVLYDELERAAKEAQHSRGYDHIFDKLKREVITETRNRHQWDSKAITRLVRSFFIYRNQNVYLLVSDLRPIFVYHREKNG